MKPIQNFKLTSVPQHNIMLVVTSEPDYEMQRILIAEDWPDYGNFTVIEGGHCSCYGFDDTEWDATIYTEQELSKVLTGWLTNGYGVEKDIAQLWLMSGRKLNF